MKILAILSILLILLSSCQKESDLKYTTDTLDCLKIILEKNTNGNEAEVLKTLDKYADKFKFAADLKTSAADRLAIKNASDIANSGQLDKAKALLEDQIVQRGYSDTIEQSLNNIDKALVIKNYLNSAEDLDISDRAREFSQLKAHTYEEYKELPEYTSWLKAETQKILDITIADKEQIIRSFKFTADYFTLGDPELAEVVLLQIASQESSILIPGFKDNIKEEIGPQLKRKSLKAIVQDGFAATSKTYKQAEQKGIPSLQKQLTYTHLLAKGGQISKTLESLQELNDLCEVDEKYRRLILKELFLSKGWNDASLINRDFLDISYLLETVYKANQ